MFIRTCRAERMKLRRSMIWLALAVLPLLSAFLGTMNYLNNLGMLDHDWYDLWTQHALFYCTLFSPALTGVYCAYACRLEHLNRNWNQVMTMPVSPACIFASKLAAVSTLTAVTQLLIGVFYIIAGKLAGLATPPPIQLVYWLLRGWWSLTVIAAILLCVALVFRSFAIPIGAGILGGFLGLPALIKGFGAYMPFAFTPLSMCSHNPAEPMDCPAWLFALTSSLYLLAACAFGIRWLRRRDVTTG